MGKGSSSAPMPDPNIGLAAMKEAQLGEEWLKVAKEQYGVANERQGKLDALTEKVTNSQLTSLDNANTWAQEDRARYKSVYQPMEDDFIKTANEWDSPERQAQVAAEAKADVLGAAKTQQQARERSMASMGVNPASGRFAGVERSADTATALASAGAQNAGRNTVRNQAVALKADAINMGKGLPAQATQSLGLGVQTGNSVVGNNTSVNGVANQNVGILQSGYTGAMNGYAQQGSILNNLYQSQLSGWQAQQNQNNAFTSDIMGGLGMGAALMFSDENAKENKQPVEGALGAVEAMPVEEWSYKPGMGDGERHIGTYAQDFQQATGKGDGKSIPVIDAIGVTMGAVKELSAKVDKLSKGLPQAVKRNAGRSRGIIGVAA